MKNLFLIQNELLSLETNLTLAEFRHNEKWLNEIISDNFTEIGSSGKSYNKKEVIKALLNSESSYYNISEFNVIEIADNTCLATFTTTNNSNVVKRSSIWVNKENNWQIVFHQGTKV